MLRMALTCATFGSCSFVLISGYNNKSATSLV